MTKRIRADGIDGKKLAQENETYVCLKCASKIPSYRKGLDYNARGGCPICHTFGWLCGIISNKDNERALIVDQHKKLISPDSI